MWDHMPPKHACWVIYRADEDSPAECLYFTDDGLVYRAGADYPINIKGPLPSGLYWSEPIDMHEGD